MAQAMGMQPKRPVQALSIGEQRDAAFAAQKQQEDALQLQRDTVALQKQQVERQTADLAKQDATTKAATDATESARLGRQRGRLSLLNDEMGTILAPTQPDLQRRLGG